MPAAGDGLSGAEREAAVDEIIADTLASASEDLRRDNAQTAASPDVWEQFASCVSAQVLAHRSGGPLGLKNHPPVASNGDLHETAEQGDVVLARWREYLRTSDGAPRHAEANDAMHCIDHVWKDDNPASFEHGLIFNKCAKPIRLAYCVIGIDCHANKGSIRALAPGEASRFGDRDHKNFRAGACFGKIFPIGQLDRYSCE
jgi:hypothetical protein